jgi:hypothetical protein
MCTDVCCAGATVALPLVVEGRPPRNREERLDVINRIYEHVSYVKSVSERCPL